MPGLRSLVPVCVLALALGGCDGLLAPRSEGPAPAPAWFLHPPQQPGMLFAVGSAEAGNRALALARAHQDLVSQLRLTIRSQAQRNEEYASQDATGTNRAERLAQQARSEVQTKASAEDLPGVTVAEQVDTSTACYLLIRLDRQAWAADLRERLAGLDARLPGEVAAITALPTATPREQLAAAGVHIRRLLPLLVERDEYLTRLRTALPGTAMPADPIDRAGLDRRLQNLLAGLTVSLPADPSVKPLEGQLIESLRGIGLRTVAADQNGIMQLPLVLTLRSERIGDMIKLDGQLTGSLRLAPEAGGTQLGGISISERASSSREDVARERLQQKLARRLATDLDARLSRMLAGD